MATTRYPLLEKLVLLPGINSLGAGLIRLLLRLGKLGERLAWKYPLRGKQPVERFGHRIQLLPTPGQPRNPVNYYVFLGDHWDYYEQKFAYELARYIQLAIDVGGHSGLVSMLMAKANPKMKVIAFEPLSVNQARFMRNLRANNIQNVEIRQAAVSDVAGEVTMTMPLEHTSYFDNASLEGNYLEHLPTQTETVHAIPLDQLRKELRQNGEGRIEFIKIDVELHEPQVLKGAEEILAQDRPFLMIEMIDPELHELVFPDSGHRIPQEVVGEIWAMMNKHNYTAMHAQQMGVVHITSVYQRGLDFNTMFVPFRPAHGFYAWHNFEQLIHEYRQYCQHLPDDDRLQEV